MDSNRTEVVQLTKTLVIPDGGKLNLLYPHEVQFTLVDTQGMALSDVDVAVVMTNSTIQNTNWIFTLFGISTETTPVNSTVMYGSTDSGGQITFPLISSGKYTMVFNSTSKGIAESKTIYPQQANYVMVLHPNAALIPNRADYINGTLSQSTPNTSWINLNFSYSDTSASTASVTFYVDTANKTRVYTQTYTGATLVNASKPIANVAGTSYVWGYYANSSTFGNVSAAQGIIPQGVKGKLVDLDPCGGYVTGWGNTC
jgi:hypothetical protein